LSRPGVLRVVDCACVSPPAGRGRARAWWRRGGGRRAASVRHEGRKAGLGRPFFDSDCTPFPRRQTGASWNTWGICGQLISDTAGRGRELAKLARSARTRTARGTGDSGRRCLGNAGAVREVAPGSAGRARARGYQTSVLVSTSCLKNR
jgi:hypothetical protein